MSQRFSEVRLYRSIRSSVTPARAQLLPPVGVLPLRYWAILALASIVGLFSIWQAWQAVTDPRLDPGMLWAMPYFVHLPGLVPSTGMPFDSRADAHEYAQTRQDKPEVSFVISDEECVSWRAREYQRFVDGVYKEIPWIERYGCWEPRDPHDQEYRIPAIAHHFAHISLRSPGCIAYTPNDEYGIQDRQTVIKTGRYLEQYCANYFNKSQIAVFVDKVKAMTGGFQIATTPADVIAVYTNGPRSCMSRPASRYMSEVHPSAAYGNSDLAVAYLGTLENVSARCIIWPAKKIYTRVYGDTTLIVCLDAAGYEQGSIDGARIRAMEHSDSVYVMPYIDGCNSADLDDTGEYLILQRDGDGEYQTHYTRDTRGETLCTGITEDGDDEELYECNHCGVEMREDNTYCDECNDERTCCVRCDEETFNVHNDDFVEVYDDWYCSRCAERYARTCAVCDHSWYERNPDHADLCEDCADRHAHCRTCDAIVLHVELTDRLCENCRPSDEDASDDDATPIVPASFRYPSITDTITIRLSNGELHSVLCSASYGALLVHRTWSRMGDDLTFTVTHALTGVCVLSCNSYRDACLKAAKLAFPGLDWGFTDYRRAPNNVLAYARLVDSEVL